MATRNLELFQKYWLNALQFVGVLFFTLAARIELPSLTGIIRWFGICFFISLFVACVYEIPIKIGISQGHTKSRIIREIVIVWIIPLISGYLLAGCLIH